MEIVRQSQLSGAINVMDIDISEELLARVENRRANQELIQNIVPHLPKEEREFLVTGITPEEWELAFADMAE
jgi:hypothetical protein